MKEHENFYSNLLPNLPVASFMTKRSSYLDPFLEEAGLTKARIVQMQQPHEANVAEFSLIGQNAETVIAGVDAVFTQEPDTYLVVRSADCLPILFYHPLPLVGAIHAGRKGTQLGIVRNVFSSITEKFGLSGGFTIFFGPAICKACYQVDREKDLHYDLIAENKSQLDEVLSMSSSKLILSGFCTAHHNDLFFSYRKEGPGAGRMSSVIALKNF